MNQSNQTRNSKSKEPIGNRFRRISKTYDAIEHRVGFLEIKTYIRI
jgi:hypothetical protein